MSGPLSLTVSGFNCVAQGGASATLCTDNAEVVHQFVPAQLFAKNESGLGLAGGPNGGEIGATSLPNVSNFIQLDMGSMLAASMLPSDCPLVPTNSHCTFVSGVSVNVNGTSNGLAPGVRYDLWLSTVPGQNNGLFGEGFTPSDFNIPTDLLFMGCAPVVEGNASPCRFVDLTAEPLFGSVLLADVEVTTTTRTPEPSSAGLLLIGLGALVVAGTLGKKLIA